MKICKFQGATMREAIAQVRRELGADAMVVATRQVRRGLLGGGVEVTAAIDVDEPAVSPATTEAAAAAVLPRGISISDGDVERIMAPLRSELRSIRSMLRPIATAVPDDELRGELSALRQAIAGIRRAASAADGTDPEAPPQGNLEDVAAGVALAAQSDKRVVALVGPTGSGKTTTVAKLAARAALVEHRSVAILTLDTYRIGGEEQIRAYADLMGVPLHLVPDPQRLGATVSSLARFDRIYVDTAGRSPRDVEALAQLERALSGVADLELHLVVAATAQASLVDNWMRRYRSVGIDRLLFTKIDEAADLGELVRAPARLSRPISYIANGQRVPEDLEVASDDRLLDLATRGFSSDEVAA